MKNLWIYLCCCTALFGCRKADEVDPIPVLTFEAISSTDVVQFENLIVLTLGIPTKTVTSARSTPMSTHSASKTTGSRNTTGTTSRL